jgi:hypothetical protein
VGGDDIISPTPEQNSPPNSNQFSPNLLFKSPLSTGSNRWQCSDVAEFTYAPTAHLTFPIENPTHISSAGNVARANAIVYVLAGTLGCCNITRMFNVPQVIS